MDSWRNRNFLQGFPRVQIMRQPVGWISLVIFQRTWPLPLTQGRSKITILITSYELIFILNLEPLKVKFFQILKHKLQYNNPIFCLHCDGIVILAHSSRPLSVTCDVISRVERVPLVCGSHGGISEQVTEHLQNSHLCNSWLLSRRTVLILDTHDLCMPIYYQTWRKQPCHYISICLRGLLSVGVIHNYNWYKS